jgi:hypothetical protein
MGDVHPDFVAPALRSAAATMYELAVAELEQLFVHAIMFLTVVPPADVDACRFFKHWSFKEENYNIHPNYKIFTYRF